MTPRFTAIITTTGPAQPSTQDIGQTIRDAVQEAKREAQEQVREAQQQAREAQQRVREAQQEIREAQQEVREAQQQVREARTADQRGGAEQELFGAEQELKEAEARLRQLEQHPPPSPPFVYTSQQPDDFRPHIPGEAVDIAIGFFITCAVIIVGWPIARALGRRFERRGVPLAVEAGVTDQLQRIEQAVEAIAIEVERISESQRFLAKLQEKSPAALE